jgi:hypothetical protein
MTKTRNISDLLDANGDVKSTALDNVPASNDASALTTGTLDSARLGTVTSFASTGIDDNATSTAITIDSSGFVGIGLTNPTAQLHVNTNSTGRSNVYFSNFNTSGGISSQEVAIGFQFNRTGGGINLSGARVVAGKEREWVGAASNQDGFLAFETCLNESVSEKMRIDSYGNVGIGETSLATLTGSASPGLIIKSDAPFIALKDNNNSNKTSYITNQDGILKFGRVDDDLSSNQVQAMQIDNEGNVSIGTTTSLHNLHVQANGQTTDSWLRHGDTLSCSGSWGGFKQIQVDWDIVHSVSYAFEFITASYGSRKHFVVGSYYSGSSHQTTMTDNGGGTMTQGGNSGGERWTSSGGTHGVYCCRITTGNGHHNALVTLI